MPILQHSTALYLFHFGVGGGAGGSAHFLLWEGPEGYHTISTQDAVHQQKNGYPIPRPSNKGDFIHQVFLTFLQQARINPGFIDLHLILEEELNDPKIKDTQKSQ